MSEKAQTRLIGWTIILLTLAGLSFILMDFEDKVNAILAPAFGLTLMVTAVILLNVFPISNYTDED